MSYALRSPGLLTRQAEIQGNRLDSAAVLQGLVNPWDIDQRPGRQC
ncbi:MAG: hypothetical protein AAEC03_05025 [Synechococcus sp.]